MLGITFTTAACHRYRLMDKLGIHETASLVLYANSGWNFLSLEVEDERSLSVGRVFR